MKTMNTQSEIAQLAAKVRKERKIALYMWSLLLAVFGVMAWWEYRQLMIHLNIMCGYPLPKDIQPEMLRAVLIIDFSRLVTNWSVMLINILAAGFSILRLVAAISPNRHEQLLLKLADMMPENESNANQQIVGGDGVNPPPQR